MNVLYLLMFLVPVFGATAWYFGIHFMGNVHENSDKHHDVFGLAGTPSPHYFINTYLKMVHC